MVRTCTDILPLVMGWAIGQLLWRLSDHLEEVRGLMPFECSSCKDSRKSITTFRVQVDR